MHSAPLLYRTMPKIPNDKKQISNKSQISISKISNLFLPVKMEIFMNWVLEISCLLKFRI